MELQCCQVIPTEDSLDIYASTQWMELTQMSASNILNIPGNRQVILLLPKEEFRIYHVNFSSLLG